MSSDGSQPIFDVVMPKRGYVTLHKVHNGHLISFSLKISRLQFVANVSVQISKNSSALTMALRGTWINFHQTVGRTTHDFCISYKSHCISGCCDGSLA